MRQMSDEELNAKLARMDREVVSPKAQKDKKVALIDRSITVIPTALSDAAKRASSLRGLRSAREGTPPPLLQQYTDPWPVKAMEQCSSPNRSRRNSDAPQPREPLPSREPLPPRDLLLEEAQQAIGAEVKVRQRKAEIQEYAMAEMRRQMKDAELEVLTDPRPAPDPWELRPLIHGAMLHPLIDQRGQTMQRHGKM